jgi:hypothetical protein
VVSTGTKTKALCVGTRCVDVGQFIATFHKFCDDETFFVATLTQRPVGLETAFSIQLADKTPVLRGLCVVREAWATPANPFKRPGIRLGIVRLTRDSVDVYKRLRAWRAPTGDVAGADSPEPVLSTESVATAKPLGIPPRKLPIPPVIPALVRATQPFGAKVVRSTPPGAVEVVPGAPTPAPPVTRPRPPVPHSAFIVPEPRAEPLAAPDELRARLARPKPAERESPKPSEVPKSAERGARVPEVAKSESVAAEPRVLGVARSEPVAVEPHAEVARPEPVAATFDDAPVAVDAFGDVTAPNPAPAASTEVRTPGSDLVLPANPLMNLTDESLEGFVDCTLYEDTGAFPLDEVTPLPGRRPLSVAMPPIEPPLASPSMTFAAVDGRLDAPPGPSSIDGYQQPIDSPAVGRTPSMALAALEGPAVGRSPSMALGEIEVAHAISDEPPPSSTSVMPPIMPVPVPPILPAPLGMTPIEPPTSFPHVPVARPGSTASTRPIAIRARWWIIAAPSIIVLAIVIIMVTRSRASDDPSEPGPAEPKQPETQQTKPPAPPETVKKQPLAAAGSDEDPPPPDHGNGPPVVGKGPCRIAVVVEPAGAAIQLDGELVGPSPLTIDGPCTKRRIDLGHARYQNTTRWVTPTAGKPESLDVTLPRPTHSVTVVTQPTGATVSIDGKRAGTSPTIVQIMGFTSMSITVDKPGFQSVTQRIYSKLPNDRVVITLTGVGYIKRR